MGTKPKVGTRGKRELIDYDWILSQSDEPTCVSISERTRQLLITLLPPARWLKRYYSTVDTEMLFENVALFHDDAMRQLLGEAGECEEMTECPDPCPELPEWIFDPPIWLTDPDETPPWVNEPNQPPGGVPPPPIPGENGVPIGQDICCLQAANAELTIARLTQQLVAETLGATNPFALATSILGLFALFGFPAIAVLLTLASYLLQNIEALEEDLTAAFDALRCALYLTCTDGTWSSIEAVKAQISADVSEPIASYFNAVMDALQVSGLMAAAALGELKEFDCADCLPEPCDCPSCTVGTAVQTVYQQSEFDFPDNIWDTGTYAGRSAAYNNNTSTAPLHLDLGEEKCVKAILITSYENVAHTMWLAVKFQFPNSSYSDEELSWSQGSSLWSNHTIVFDEPICISEFQFIRGDAAGAGNDEFLVDSITVYTCE